MAAGAGAAVAAGGASLFGKILEIRQREREVEQNRLTAEAGLIDAAKQRQLQEQLNLRQQLAGAFGQQQQAIQQGAAGIGNQLTNLNSAFARTIG